MYYPDAKEYITFLFSLLDAFAERNQKVISRERPKTYSDAALVVFYAVMTLKQINTTRGQHRWLYTHPILLETLRLPCCPSRSTLTRRYKVLLPLLSEFCEFIADWSVSIGTLRKHKAIPSVQQASLGNSAFNPYHRGG